MKHFTRQLQRPLRPLLAALFLVLSAVAALGQAQSLDRVQELLDAGEAAAALQALEPILRQEPKRADALLARSTGRFLLGDLEKGEKDLRRALDRDPSLRQGWLNLGALELAVGNAEKALEAFRRARRLDPDDREVALNVGAALLLLGRLEEAREQFGVYIEAKSDAAEAHRLVAQNYALANAIDDATRHAAAAIAKNERLRLDIRTDPAFDRALDDPAFQRLLATESYRPEPGSLVVEETFDEPYDSVDAKMLGAVVDALDALGIPYDPRVEATDRWALVWTENLRLKIAALGDRSTVEITAPPRSHTRSQWEALQENLFGQIRYELTPKLPPGVQPP